MIFGRSDLYFQQRIGTHLKSSMQACLLIISGSYRFPCSYGVSPNRYVAYCWSQLHSTIVRSHSAITTRKPALLSPAHAHHNRWFLLGLLPSLEELSSWRKWEVVAMFTISPYWIIQICHFFVTSTPRLYFWLVNINHLNRHLTSWWSLHGYKFHLSTTKTRAPARGINPLRLSRHTLRNKDKAAPKPS